MRTIWKYPLRPGARTALEMPKGAVFLAVQEQAFTPTLWMEVDTDQPTVFVQVGVVQTGEDLRGLAPGMGYAGTVQTGPYVWHLYLGNTRGEAV